MKLTGITPKIYIVTIVLTFLVGVGTVEIFVLWLRIHPVDDVSERARYFAKGLAKGDPTTLDARAAELATDLKAMVVVVGDERRNVANSIGSLCPDLAQTPGCATGSFTLPDGKSRVEVTILTGSAPPLAYFIALDAFVLALGAVLLGQAFARPLRKIAKTADTFGNGDLRARNHISRGDEIGDVANAFDHMADRITDLLRIERELLANISHELRTPMTRIRLALELAASGNAEVIRDAYTDMVEDLEELEQLVAGVLATARVELDETGERKGISPLRLEDVSLHEIVDRAAARFRRNYPERELVVGDVDPGLRIDADPIQLRRAIENLLVNAEKYTEDTKASIEVEADVTPSNARIRIVDHGIGISESDQENVFKPFFRAKKDSRAASGLGLGLALVRRIVEAHGGDVQLESAVGKGTTVTIALPRS